jgi:hypothetical protein
VAPRIPRNVDVSPHADRCNSDTEVALLASASGSVRTSRAEQRGATGAHTDLDGPGSDADHRD